MTPTYDDDAYATEAEGEAAQRRAREAAGVEPKKQSVAAMLVDQALELYDFRMTTDGDSVAIPKPGGHVVRPLKGGRTSLRAELAKAFRDRHDRVPGQQALADALLILEGHAQAFEPVPVHLRVAEHAGGVWIDLGDADERVVRVDSNGWSVVDEGVPVLFRRTVLTAALPVPWAGGRLDELWALLNVAVDERPLVLAWLVAALGAPTIPHPVLAILGEQGTGKSTACRTLIQLVDPSPVPLRKSPRDSDGWVTAASGSWAVGLDNLSAIPEWLSDTLCRAVTGDGDVRRQLYTDSGLAVFAFRRVLLLNGIDVGALKPDLADRTIVVNLELIGEEDRLEETELAAEWSDAWPRVFAALLDEVSGVLALRPSVHLGAAPRMADFARVLAALDERHGTDAVKAYTEQARTLASDVVSSDPFLAAVDRLLVEPFAGTSAQLLEFVTPLDDGWHAPKEWPTNARAVTARLQRNAPALRKVGWSVEKVGTDWSSNVQLWSITRPEMDRNRPSVPSYTRPSPREPRVPRVGLPASLVRYCSDCGEPFSEPGLTQRCRQRHAPEVTP